MRDELAALGLQINQLIAGFTGGLVYALVAVRALSFQAISSVIVGTLTANYFSDYVAKWFGLSLAPGAFLVGLTAMVACQTVIQQAANWRPKIPGGSK